MWRTDCLKLKQKVGKRCQTPLVWDIPEDQTVRVCALACLYTCSYKRLWLFVWVNLSYCVYRCAVASWVVFVCVCRGQRQRKRVNVVCCVCVCWPVFVDLTAASNHPGLMATQLWQSTSNTSREFSGWFVRKKNEGGGGEQHHQKLLGRYSWLP